MQARGAKPSPHIPSLRAQRLVRRSFSEGGSNPECFRGGILDCFVASAPRNDGVERMCATLHSRAPDTRGTCVARDDEVGATALYASSITVQQAPTSRRWRSATSRGWLAATARARRWSRAPTAKWGRDGPCGDG